MAYKVQITDFAWNQLNNITDYIFYSLKNPEAAERVLDDFYEAVDTLEKSAGAFAPLRGARAGSAWIHPLSSSKTSIYITVPVGRR